MANERLTCAMSCKISCTKSFFYLEILLETLVILVVATELSLEYTNDRPDTRVDPGARGGFVKALLGIWQGADIWADLTMHPKVSSIFSLAYRTMYNRPYWFRTISGFSTLSFTIGTALLYIAFAVFLFSNRNWKPALFDVPNHATKASHDTANRLIWQILGLQGYFPIFLISSHFGWPEIPFFNVLVLTVVWFHVFSTCKLLCMHVSGNGSPTLVQNWKVLKISAVLSKRCILSAASCTLGCGGRMLVSIVAVCLLAVVPLVPVLIWSGLLQLIVFLFGTQAAFPAHIVLSIALITYANGRLVGLWITKSHVRWITIKILSALGKTTYMDQLFIFKRTTTELDRNVQYVQKEVTSLFLDCMSICVVSFPLWAAYVIGMNIEAYNSGSAFLVRSFFGDRILPQSLAPILAKVSYWTNITCPSDAPTKCNEFQSVPVDGVIGTIGMVVSATLAHATLLTLIVVLVLVFMLYLVRGIKKLSKLCWPVEDEKKSNNVDEQTSWNKLVWIARLHDCHSAMALVPQDIVKVIFAVYALELFLPENLFLPGITVWLICSAVCFYKNLFLKVLAFVKCGIAKVMLDFDGDNAEDGVGAKEQLNLEPRLTATVSNGTVKDAGSQLKIISLV